MSEIKIKAMKNHCFAFLLFGIISIWLSIISRFTFINRDGSRNLFYSIYTLLVGYDIVFMLFNFYVRFPFI